MYEVGENWEVCPCVTALKIQHEINEKSWNKWQYEMVINNEGNKRPRLPCIIFSPASNNLTIVVEENLLAPFASHDTYWEKSALNNNTESSNDFFRSPTHHIHKGKSCDSNVGQFKLVL